MLDVCKCNIVVTQNGEMELNNTALSFDTNSDSKQKQKNKI